MNLKRQKFVTAYIELGNATQAAIQAGYSKRSAGTLGSSLLQNVEIKAEIERIKAEVRSKAIMTLTEAQEILTEMGRGKLQNYLRADGSVDPRKVVAGGADVLEYTSEDTEHGVRTKIRLNPQKGAIETLGKFAGWEKAPPQKIVFDLNLTGDTNDE